MEFDQEKMSQECFYLAVLLSAIIFPGFLLVEIAQGKKLEIYQIDSSSSSTIDGIS